MRCANKATLERVESTILSSLYALPFYDFDLRASHARTLLPAALASVPFGFVLVRVRVALTKQVRSDSEGEALAKIPANVIRLQKAKI